MTALTRDFVFLSIRVSVRVKVASGLEVFAKFFRIEIVRGFVDVHEYDPRARLRDRFGRRDERIRNRDDGVAGAHTGRDQRKPQRIRATADANAMRSIAELREILLEPLNHRSADEPGRFKSGLENLAQFFLQLRVRSDEIKKGNFIAPLISRSLRQQLHFARRAPDCQLPPYRPGHPWSRRSRRRQGRSRRWSHLQEWWRPIRWKRPFFTRVVSTFQSFSVCKPPSSVVARGIAVVDEGHVVPDENIVFDGHAFADEGVAGNLAPRADSGVLLNLNKRSDLGFIPNLAPIEVDELGQLDVLAELDVGRDALKSFMRTPPLPCDSRTPRPLPAFVTIRQARQAVVDGRLAAYRMHSTKYASSALSASVASTLGAHMSPER